MTIPLDSRIVSNPKIRSGQPCIAGHRITVNDIVVWHELMGKDVDEIAEEYDLSLVEIYVALAYYFDNKEEIDSNRRETEKYMEEFRKNNPSHSKLRRARGE